MPRILFAEHCQQFVIHQVMLKAVQHRRFEHIAPDRALVLAGAFVARTRAAEMVLADLDERAAAAAAFDEAGEQKAGAATVPEPFGLGLVMLAECRCVLPGLYLLPQIIVDDSQMRHLLHDPLIGRIEARQSLARFGVLDVAQTVPDQPSDIELVVQDASAAILVAMDRRRPPCLAGRPWHVLSIQRLRDHTRGRARCILIEDAAHDIGLTFVDLAIPAFRLARVVDLANNIIPVRIAPAGFASFDTAAQAASCLVRQVFEEEGVHRPLQADMKLADRPFAECDDLHACKAQPLEDAGDVFLVAGNPVQRLGYHHLKLARHSVLQELLDTGTHQAGTGDAMIGVVLLYRHAFAGRTLAAQPELIFDRGGRLHIR